MRGSVRQIITICIFGIIMDTSTNCISHIDKILKLINKDNIEQYQVLLNTPDWNKIDFRYFSLLHQPEKIDYQFDFLKVLFMLNQ